MPDQQPLFSTSGGSLSSAVISECGTYRYRLTRQWTPTLPALGWVMLNPSTADNTVNDPTIRRCIAFAKAWGYGGIAVRNLYALRATSPKELATHPDPVGPGNDVALKHVAVTEPVTVLAWGANAPADRAEMVTALLKMQSGVYGTSLAVLGWTKSGAPRHPLYVRADTTPEFLHDRNALQQQEDS